MSDSGLKVTDHRMFTPDGELREEFRDPRPQSTADSELDPSRRSNPRDLQPPLGGDQPPPAATIERPLDPVPTRQEVPGAGEQESDAPGFFDLVGLLAEPVPMYLREARSADPQTAAQSLELARVHIDLLAVLHRKTQGNLSPSESAMLEDVIYQLRSGYVGLGR